VVASVVAIVRAKGEDIFQVYASQFSGVDRPLDILAQGQAAVDSWITADFLGR